MFQPPRYSIQLIGSLFFISINAVFPEIILGQSDDDWTQQEKADQVREGHQLNY